MSYKSNKEVFNEYQIDNITDIGEMITVDNIDNFLKDFEAVIRNYLVIKEIAKINNKKPEIKLTNFKWIDDNKQIITFIHNDVNDVNNDPDDDNSTD